VAGWQEGVPKNVKEGDTGPWDDEKTHWNGVDDGSVSAGYTYVHHEPSNIGLPYKTRYQIPF
jgi:hypothetical protein